MYARLLDMWKRGLLTPAMVDVAVTRNWISAAQGETIKATPRNEGVEDLAEAVEA